MTISPRFIPLNKPEGDEGEDLSVEREGVPFTPDAGVWNRKGRGEMRTKSPVWDKVGSMEKPAQRRISTRSVLIRWRVVRS